MKREYRSQRSEVRVFRGLLTSDFCLLTSDPSCINNKLFYKKSGMHPIDDVWYPVVRYDTAHGFAHRDLLNIKGDAKKTPLFNQDFNDALTFAENDLKSNWAYYKERFIEENK